MKYFLICLLFSFGAKAQDMNLEETLMVLDQYADVFKKVHVGQQVVFDSFEMHGECVINEKTVMTIAELNAEYALVLNEVTITDKCKGPEIVSKKFLTRDYMVHFDAFRKQIALSLKTWKMNRRDRLLTFENQVGTDKVTMQFDLKTPLFANWGHMHHSYPGVEDHNIRFTLDSRVINSAEMAGLTLCQREPLTLDILSCE